MERPEGRQVSQISVVAQLEVGPADQAFAELCSRGRIQAGSQYRHAGRSSLEKRGLRREGVNYLQSPLLIQ